LDQAIERARDGLQALLRGRLVDVLHHRVDARDGAGLRDAVAHGAGADDADGLDCHALSSCCIGFGTFYRGAASCEVPASRPRPMLASSVRASSPVRSGAGPVRALSAPRRHLVHTPSRPPAMLVRPQSSKVGPVLLTMVGVV